MRKTISKVLAFALVFTLAMSMVAFAEPDITSGTGTAADTTLVTITGVTPGDEVTLLAIPTDVALADVTEEDIVYIDQVTSNDEGTATFEIALGADALKIYSGYSSMGDEETPLELLYNGGEAETKTYKVTFNDKDGVKITEVEVEEGKTVAAADIPVHDEIEGYTFKGWFYGENNANEFNSTTVISANLTVNAVYEIEAVEILYGDVNGDGEVNMADSGVLARNLADWPVEIVEANSDVNDDGSVDMADLGILKRFLADWYPGQELPIK